MKNLRVKYITRVIALFMAAIVVVAVSVYGNTSPAPPPLTIRFAPSPGSFAGETSGVRTGPFGFRIDELPEPVPPAGYTFVGWFSDGVQMQAPIAAVRSTTILAAYAPIVDPENGQSFAVVYNPGEGQLPEEMLPIQSFTYGSMIISLPIPEREDYYFAHWQHDGERVTAPFVIRNDMALDAVWYDTPPQQSARPLAIPTGHYVAVFNPFPGAFNNGETGIVFQRLNATLNNSIPQEPSLQGYIFSGWRIPNGQNLDLPVFINGDIMLTAIWAEDPEGTNGLSSSDIRPNPQTSPISISLMIFVAIGMLASATAGLYILKTRHAAAQGRYHAQITRCVREMKIVVKNSK